MSHILYVAILSLLMLPAQQAATAQDALVTFYTHGSNITTGMPGSNHGVFYGLIYDGDQELFSFREGLLIKNDRYLTLHFSPGIHHFSASYAQYPPETGIVTLDLKPGDRYFLRALSKSRGVVVIERESGLLGQVSCDVATKEMKDAKLLKPKNPPPALVSMMATAQAIPACP